MSEPAEAVHVETDAPAEETSPTTSSRRSARISAQPSKPTPAPAKKRSGDEVKAGRGKRARSDAAKTAGEAEEAAAEVAPEEPTDEPTLEIGGALPSVTVQNEKGEDVETTTIVAEKGVVLFLVPKADTPGCTTQACGFRDVYSEFGGVGYDVYCLSADSPSAQTKWQTKKTLPYGLLSDPKRTLISALGAGAGGKTKRSHFVFEKGGKLLDKQMPVKPAESPKLALDFIKGLQAS